MIDESSVKKWLPWIGVMAGVVNISWSQEVGPQVAYPRPFSRPPAMGKDYDTWQDAKGPDIGEARPDIGRLPSRVDNSDRPEFPPIYKQKGGACGQFASVASIFTYEMNVLNGTKADSDATRFPADFSWNMINESKNQGSEAYHGWEVAKQHGIPTVKSFGYVHGEKIGKWPNGYAIWREAMEYRVAGYRYTPAVTADQVHEARGWLFDRNQPEPGKKTVGGLLALDGRMGSLKQVTRTIPEGQYLAGEELWVRWGPDGFGHGITCVGYDDQVGFDVNGDGIITNDRDANGDGQVTLADWERGAYIVVNSWGEKWSKDGKIYLLYSAMVDPTWERGNYLGRAEVCRAIPRATLKLTLSCENRAALRVSIGVSTDPNATKPQYEIEPQVLNGWPLFGKKRSVGEVPLAGPDEPTPLEMGVDLTPLWEKLGADAQKATRLMVRFHGTDALKSSAQLHACALRRYDALGRFLHETPFPKQQGTFAETPLLIDLTIPEGG